MTEPLIHSFETDCLPDEHPWAHKTVSCGYCQAMVHAFNNECMRPWVEHEGRALCTECFQRADCPTNAKRFIAVAGVFPCVKVDP